MVFVVVAPKGVITSTKTSKEKPVEGSPMGNSSTSICCTRWGAVFSRTVMGSLPHSP